MKYGDYYKLSEARKIINHSSLSKSWKKKLINFLKAVKKYGGVKKTWQKGYCSRVTALNYVKKLTNELGINPITLDEDSNFSRLDNLMKYLKKKTKEELFKK